MPRRFAKRCHVIRATADQSVLRGTRELMTEASMRIELRPCHNPALAAILSSSAPSTSAIARCCGTGGSGNRILRSTTDVDVL